jgi:hypothetical protein
VQVDVAELRHDHVQQVRTLQAADLRLELELRDDVLSPLVESADVAAEVLADVRRVVQQRLERELGHVVEAVLGDLVQHEIDVLQAALLQLLVPLEHPLLGRLQHRVQPAEDRERQDDLPVLGLLVVAPEKVGHRPDERDLLLEVVHGLLPCLSPVTLPRQSAFMSEGAATLCPTSPKAVRGCSWAFGCGGSWTSG